MRKNKPKKCLAILSEGKNLMTSKILLVKALLIHKRESIFYFLTRSLRKKFRFMGDLPGGRVEQGESPLSAMQREIQEETGLLVPALNLLTIYDWSENEEYREYLYYARVDEPKVVLSPEEHISFRWIAFDAVEESTLHPGVKKIIKSQQDKISLILEKI